MATWDQIPALLRSAVEARRAGRLDDAWHKLNEALARCEPGQDEDRASVLRELGELARGRQDLAAAQAHYEEAVALLKSSQDHLKLAHTIRHLGDVHAKQQHWTAAERCYVEALQIYRHHPDSPRLDLANTIRPLALLKTETGRREEAHLLWTEAGELYQAEGIQAGVEECRQRTAHP
jgi:tetratricopeptide (TPR) repeat protein